VKKPHRYRRSWRRRGATENFDAVQVAEQGGFETTVRGQPLMTCQLPVFGHSWRKRRIIRSATMK
jgi:hypothetical protein